MTVNVLSMIDTQVPPCTPASNAESPAPAAIVDRNNSSGGNTNASATAAAAADSSKSRMLNKRQSTTESAVSASEVLCDSMLAGWEPEREEAAEVGGDSNGGSNVIVENGDESDVAKVPMPFSRIATNLGELHKVSICKKFDKVDPQQLFHPQLLSTINVWGLNVFRASDFVVQKRVLTCVNMKIYQVK